MYLTYIQGILHHIDAPKLWGPIGKRVGLECSGYIGGINLYFLYFLLLFLFSTVTTLSIGSPAVMEFQKPKVCYHILIHVHLITLFSEARP